MQSTVISRGLIMAIFFCDTEISCCLSLLRFVIINVEQDAILGVYSDIYCCLTDGH